MFTCGICQNSFDDAFINEHHRIPRAFGGTDSPDNLRILDPNCHQSLHRLAEMMANPHKKGLVRDHAINFCRTACNNDSNKASRAVNIILDLADCAYQYEIKVQSGTLKLNPWSDKVISFTVPEMFKTAFETACKRKTPFGRRGSMQGVLEEAMLNVISQEFPHMRKDIQAYILGKTKK